MVLVSARSEIIRGSVQWTHTVYGCRVSSPEYQNPGARFSWLSLFPACSALAGGAVSDNRGTGNYLVLIQANSGCRLANSLRLNGLDVTIQAAQERHKIPGQIAQHPLRSWPRHRSSVSSTAM